MRRMLSRVGVRGCRTTIPEHFTEKMGITPGDYVAFSDGPDGAIVCQKPISAKGLENLYPVYKYSPVSLSVTIPMPLIKSRGLKLPCPVTIDMVGKALHISPRKEK